MNKSQHFKLIVIGGGSAGIFAAWSAASHGLKTLLIEKNKDLGRKLLISGSGKCNITHTGSVEDLLRGFPKREANFLKHSFYRFSNFDVLKLLYLYGMKTYTREDGKIFPVTNKSSDVLNVFKKILADYEVKVLLNTNVQEIKSESDYKFIIKTNDNYFESEFIIIATGGLSYPHTGSTGDGYLFAKKLGHTIVDTKAALAPIDVSPRFPNTWKGIAIRNGSLSCYLNNKKLIEENGDVLFTHRGLSGPAILELSRYAAEYFVKGDLYLYYDLFPSKLYEEVDDELKNNFYRNPNMKIENELKIYLPNRIIWYFLSKAGVDEKKRCNQINKNERKRIVELLKRLPLGKIEFIDLKRGEVTAGGVSLSEIYPKTMESKKIKGLYFCGEVLDIAGRIGGYNLQAAYSTGYVAGESVANQVKSRLLK